MDKILDVLNMEITVKGLINEADKRFRDWRGPDKEEWVTNFAYVWLERFDNVIPTVGGYLDLPVCDTLERAAVRQLVKAVFDGMDRAAKAPPKTPKEKISKEVIVPSP